LRTAKITFFMLSLTLASVGCGDKKEGPDAMAMIHKNKFVRIATDPSNLPFEFGSGTGVQGLDVDIGNEICKDLGYEAKWVKTKFEDLFSTLQTGSVEIVISAISITPERKKDFAFTDSYYDSGNTIAIRADREGIKDLASLSGKKVGVQSSATGDKLMQTQKSASGVTIVRFPTLDDALGALNRKEIDAVVGDEPILMFSIAKSFDNLMTTGTTLNEEKYGVVVRKEEKELFASVNNTISRLKKSGQLEVLRKKWFQDVLEQARKKREDKVREDALKESPKEVTFNFNKQAGNFRMDRLDGYEVILQGAQAYKSTPILTTENRGSCRVATVPPGEYRLSMPIFKLNTTLKIPNTASRSITFDMNIGASGLSIVQK
jgi:ABC-type amino acid transport substrate-binding protein